MPELPEVETIKNDLLPVIAGHRFVGVELLWERTLNCPLPDEFRCRLAGQSISDIGRRGKYLLFRLDSGDVLIFHMRMTGVLSLRDPAGVPEKHTRAVFRLDNGKALFFNDVRKLGKIWLVDDEDTVIGMLGPEPLSTVFTPQVMAQRLVRRSVPIKALLCDQSFLAGVGNMYADEALFDARIHPLRQANGLSFEEVNLLYLSVRKVLESAIVYGGATVSDYLRPGGIMGEAQTLFKVAHHLGKPCTVCGTPIERIRLRGRGSYYCPKCQPLPLNRA